MLVWPVSKEYRAFRLRRTSCSTVDSGLEGEFQTLLFEVAVVSVGITEAATKLTCQGDYADSDQHCVALQVVFNQWFNGWIPIEEAAGRVLAKLVDTRLKSPLMRDQAAG